MNTSAVTLGINATNEARQRNVSASAQQKIGYILEERAKIKAFNEAKKVQQDGLAKLAVSEVTYHDVTGQSLPATPNQNQATIIKAIAEMNEAKQKQVTAQSRLTIDSIKGYDDSIAATETRIAGMIEELNKLSLDVVTEEQVVG